MSLKDFKNRLHKQAMCSSETFENFFTYLFSRRYSAELLRLIINKLFKTNSDKSQLIHSCAPKFTILCPKFMLFLGEMIQRVFSQLGIVSNIVQSEPVEGYSSHQTYIVLCPQHFKALPPEYIVFQLEQIGVSDRFRNTEYMTLLKNATAIMDYSRKNVDYLVKQGFKNCFYTPIFSKVIHSFNTEPTYDVVFYGSQSSKHRQEYLAQLQKDFNVLIARGVSGMETIKAVQKAKVVVNIHNYDNALLESTRIFECLSAGCVIVSEDGTDQNEYTHLEKIVDFVESNNYEQLKAAISKHVNSNDTIKRREQIAQNLENQFDRFGFSFSRMLLALGFISFDQFTKTWVNVFPNIQSQLKIERSEDKIEFGHSDLFPTIRHYSPWLVDELNTKFLCLKAKCAGAQYLLIDFSKPSHPKQDLSKLADKFLSANTLCPTKVGDVVFIPKSAFDEIINWNEYPRLIESSRYCLWDNFQNN